MNYRHTAGRASGVAFSSATDLRAGRIATVGASRAAIGTFAATVFLSAFLLFQVQPLIAKAILPWYGGTPAVWTTCMLFFQVGLFAGYAYAHLLVRRLSPGGQKLVHLALLALVLAMLPILPGPQWKPLGSEPPVPLILGLLAVHVGLPFFVLSATTPLLQRWFAYAFAGQSPYRLYALSNAGSLLALLTYPFVVEPTFSIPTQSAIWSGGMALFAVLCTACAWIVRRSMTGALPCADDVPDRSPARRPTLTVTAMWFLLAMAASVMLLATTNQVSLDVAAVPFLWVLPLALYLFSFILCFGGERWYPRRLCGFAFPLVMGLVVWTILLDATAPVLLQLVAFLTGLFACCMICHGELVRLKPDARHLTSFYLLIAAGGAAGGLFVGVLAPLAFSGFWELHLAIVGTCALLLGNLVRERGLGAPLRPPGARRRPGQARTATPRRAAEPRLVFGSLATLGGLSAVLLLLAVVLVQDAVERLEGAVAVRRNFYGVLRVVNFVDSDAPRPLRRQMRLIHGRILHGMQFVSEPMRREPTAYYGRESGVGRALEMARHDAQGHPAPKRVGLVGLGVGTLAAFAEPGDLYRFYEIAPDVIRLARRHFSYLDDCRGEVVVVPGDARLSLESELEREEPQDYDVLVLDAFSSDAIPVHLVTAEAFEVYLEHLRPDGILAVHISSRHFDLTPVLAGLAARFGLVASVVESRGDEARGTFDCRWVLLAPANSRHAAALQRQRLRPGRKPVLWTDHYSNPFGVLMSRRRTPTPPDP